MTHFISESTVHEYQYSIEHLPETSSLMTSGYGTNYDFSICSRSSLSLKELQTLFPDVGGMGGLGAKQHLQEQFEYSRSLPGMAGNSMESLCIIMPRTESAWESQE